MKDNKLFINVPIKPLATIEFEKEPNNKYVSKKEIEVSIRIYERNKNELTINVEDKNVLEVKNLVLENNSHNGFDTYNLKLSFKNSGKSAITLICGDSKIIRDFEVVDYEKIDSNHVRNEIEKNLKKENESFTNKEQIETNIKKTLLNNFKNKIMLEKIDLEPKKQSKKIKYYNNIQFDCCNLRVYLKTIDNFKIFTSSQTTRLILENIEVKKIQEPKIHVEQDFLNCLADVEYKINVKILNDLSQEEKDIYLVVSKPNICESKVVAVDENKKNFTISLKMKTEDKVNVQIFYKELETSFTIQGHAKNNKKIDYEDKVKPEIKKWIEENIVNEFPKEGASLDWKIEYAKNKLRELKSVCNNLVTITKFDITKFGIELSNVLIEINLKLQYGFVWDNKEDNEDNKDKTYSLGWFF